MHIHVESYLSDLPSVVMLHGWGSSSRIWDSWLPALTSKYSITLIDLPGLGKSSLDDEDSIEEILTQLEAVIPHNSVLLGWSLGGLLSILLAQRLKEKVTALITLATNPCFVAQGDWPQAMAAEVFQQFQENVKTAPAKTLARFFMLQVRNGRDAKAVLNRLKTIDQQESPQNLLASLKLLTIDARSQLQALSVPSLHILSEQDQLVPSELAAELSVMSKNIKVVTIAQAGHVAFLSDTSEVSREIDEFINANISLKRI